MAGGNDMEKKSMLSRFKCMSVRKKLSLSLILVSLFLTAFTTICSYTLATRQVENISMRLSEQSVVAVGEDLSAKIGRLCDTSTQVVHMDAIRQISAHQEFDDTEPELLRAQQSIRNEVNNLIYPQGAEDGTFDFVGIYLLNGFACECANNIVIPFADYKQCIAYFSSGADSIADDSYSSARWVGATVNNGQTQALVYLRFVYEQATMRKIGVAVFGVMEDRIGNLYTSHLPNAYLLSRDGVILSSERKNSIGNSCLQADQLLKKSSSQNRFSRVSFLDNENKNEAFCYSLQNINAILVVPFDFYQATRDSAMVSYLRSIVIMTVVVILLAVALGILLSGGLSKSIASLVGFAKKVEAGDTECRFQPDSKDEIAYLGEHINQMLDEISKASQQREADLKANQLMEIQLLQQQINPHLLYNTLDSLLWYLQQNQNDQAIALTSSMSEFFKISLSKGSDFVTLGRELQLIQHYLEIQHVARYQDIHLICDVGEDLYDYPVIKLLLQPIVENAIIHGFAGYRDDGTIRIEALKIADLLEIVVTDNGIGILPEEIEEIQQILRQNIKEKQGRCFGLYNINRRIVQTYGANYGLSIESEISEYTAVRIRIPYSEEQERQNHERYDYR